MEGTDIPVIFSAVTDPVAAGLVENTEAPEGNITGTSDAIPVSKIFDLAAELTPDVQSFGLIYNTSEINSVSVIEETKAYLDEKGISYVENAVTATGEVQTAAQNLLNQCDAVFAPIDNTVASAMPILAEEAINAQNRCTWLQTAWWPTAALQPWASTTPTWGPRPATWWPKF